ncbi:DUF4982 domain-containing protein [candidate division KSB1 bacterium]|nr:DUF4982 domain-containing protein [candidate division KSB1 bacterium]RQW08631.1 MAG: glycoside hydrolase family 2 protein [candidate division KSB1 bacterium]
MRKTAFHLVIYVILFTLRCGQDSRTPARQCENLNSEWRFHRGDLPDAFQSDFDDSNWRELDLPHDWSIEGPFSPEWASGTGYLPGGIGWYRKQFTIPLEKGDRKIYIYFHGIYNNSQVWINGHHLGERPNGYISFQYDLTPHLQVGDTNTLAVRVDHSQYADSRWYTGSGIYRTVELISTAKLHIKQWGVYAATPRVSAEEAQLDIQTSLINEGEGTREISLQQVLRYKNRLIEQTSMPVTLAAGADTVLQQSMMIKPQLWDVEAPNLYALQTSIVSDGELIDDVETRIGFRDIRFDADSGFYLNGVNLKFKGVCLHHDAGCLGAAVPLGVWDRRLELLKEMGSNAIRTSHNPVASDFLDLCDAKGFLVIDEVFDEWELPKRKWVAGWNVGEPSYAGYAENFADWHVQDLTDQILRDRNHPSVIMWSIGNEIDYPNDPYTHEILNTESNPQTWATFDKYLPHANRLGEIARELVGIVKRYDTSRPVTAGLASALMANETGYADALDVAGYNYQEFRYPQDHLAYPNRPLYGSENGMALGAWKAVIDNEFIMGQFLWTGIEYMGEAGRYPSRNSTSGTIDLAGNKKTEFYFRQSLWSDEPMVYIGVDEYREETGAGGLWRHKRAEPHWNWPADQKVRVKAFTNCDSVELFLNDESLGSRRLADSPERILHWDVVFASGVLKAVASKGDRRVTAELRTAGAPAKLLAESDIAVLKAEAQDVAHILVRIVDEENIPVFAADNRIVCEVKGPARLLGMEDANSRNVEDYQDDSQAAHHGRILLYIQAGDQAGVAQIDVSAEGLQGDSVTLRIKDKK